MKNAGTWFLAVGLLTLSGCATTQPRNPEMTRLQMRVGQLEQEVSQRDAKIQFLESEVETLSSEVQGMRTQTVEVKEIRKTADISEDKNNIIRVPVDVNKVQTALTKSGHYDGKIDGKAGEQTKAAISAFQKDKGLKVDGVVGQQTWDELQEYL